MVVFATLDTACEFHGLRLMLVPYFQTPRLFVACLPTLITSNYICIRAIFGLMTYLVTLKTHLLGAIVTIMSVFSAEYATGFFSFIRTFFSGVTKL